MSKPKHNKKIPINLGFISTPAFDATFKAEHPVKYNILVSCAITALVLPAIVYMIFTIGIFPAPNSGWLLLGMAGAFIIGIGLANIIAVRLGQYLGHLVTGLCIGIGVLMVGPSILLLYNQTLYDLFDEEMVTYYFINLLMLCALAIYYMLFRFGIDNWLRAKGISKSTIIKSKKGKKNFWWYQEINERYDMGPLYNINRLFIIACSVALILHFLFGWIKSVSIPVSILFVLTCILAVPMSLFSSIQYNKTVYGRPFVVIAASENEWGFHSFVIDLGLAALPLVVAYAELMIISNLWQLPWDLAIK